MRHRSPQIKRSMTFLMDVNFKIEDLSDNLSRVIQSFTSGVGDINDVINLNSHVELIKEKVKEEMEANMIASTSKHKWKTVKQFQNNSIFKDDPVEVQEDKSKRLRKAEYEAARFPKPPRVNSREKGSFLIKIRLPREIIQVKSLIILVKVKDLSATTANFLAISSGSAHVTNK